MKSCKISIITVVFNNVENIEKTINSVINQTYKNIEYIVIDGGSSDGTVDIIKKHTKNIDYWISEPDKGIYDAMNKGAKKATGDYLYFLNSGDYFCDKNILAKVSKDLDSKLGLVNGSVIKLYEGWEYNYNPCFENLKKGVALPHQGSFIKKSIFDELSGYREQYKSAGDFDFFCRFFKANYSYKLIEEYIAYMPSGGFSSNKRISQTEGYKLIREHFGFLNALSHYIRKILLEQNLKKLLLKLRLKKLYEKLLKLKMKGFK